MNFAAISSQDAQLSAALSLLPGTLEQTTTTLGKAIRYIANNWDRLTLFATNPLIWLDNNATERGLRGPVVGRRNHFGSKSVRGTEVAAVLYTLVESAKVAKVDPIAYLVDAATRAKRTPGAVLLPADFTPAR